MEKCNVCGDVIVGDSGVFISGILKGAGVFGCQSCKAANDIGKLVDKIRIIQEKYYRIGWFSYFKNGKLISGHRFTFKNNDEIIINHNEGNCSVDELVEYIESTDYRNDVHINNKGRKEFYQIAGIVYPEDPFTAKNWW